MVEPTSPIDITQILANIKLIDPHTSDVGNAQRINSLHGKNVSYVIGRGWLVWDGNAWQQSVGEIEIQKMAKATMTELITVANKLDDSDKRSKIIGHAIRSENAARISGMIEMLKSEPGICIDPSAFDKDPWLLNCQNGTLDLRTGELRDHRREDLITKITACDYEPSASSETWDWFLRQVTKDNQEYIEFLSRAVGSSIVGVATTERLFQVLGPPGSGKSTFLESIGVALGNYSGTASPDTFLATKQRSGHSDDLAKLVGVRFLRVGEFDEGSVMAQGLLKAMTGGEELTVSEKHKGTFSFRPVFTPWFASNYAPRMSAEDDAIWRRVLKLSFDNGGHKPDDDGGHGERLKAELTDPKRTGKAILAWAVRGCLEYQRHGLMVPDFILKATEQLRDEMDTLSGFFEDRCIFGGSTFTTNERLQGAYEAWFKEQGSDRRYMASPKRRAAGLKRRGCKDSKDSAGNRGWFGVALS